MTWNDQKWCVLTTRDANSGVGAVIPRGPHPLAGHGCGELNIQNPGGWKIFFWKSQSGVLGECLLGGPRDGGFFLSGGVVSILDNSMEIGSGDSHDNEIVIDLFSKCHIVKKTITKDLFCHIVWNKTAMRQQLKNCCLFSQILQIFTVKWQHGNYNVPYLYRFL